jgi:UDP-N-acetylmuramoyl-L-alanyl-D-glutamate--2,6-diaminopimelate ligase
MILSELLEGLEVSSGRDRSHVTIHAVTDDSRKVQPGSLFVAVQGERVDGHRFLTEAVKAGAVAVVVDRSRAAQAKGIPASVPVLDVPDSRSALGRLAARLHGVPSSRLRMVGVTGTNGKTTVTYLCKGLLEAAGRQVGLIGTVAYQIGPERLTAGHTTPGAVELQALLARMVEAGMDTTVMEVSSHALALDRVAGCDFDVAVYTNLTQDHLDFHKDMEDYFQAKLRLFQGLSANAWRSGKRAAKRAIVNIDDARGKAVCAATGVPVWTYGLKGRADIRAERVELRDSGTVFTAETPAGSCRIESRLVGEHNVYNMLAGIGVSLHEGLTLEVIQEGVGKVVNVPGRFERVDAGQAFTVVVDYAHTEDALVRLLSAAQTLKRGRVITVFGCGGDRDRGKRPKMGRAAAERSDVVFLTSDNPRTEDPQSILREVEAGLKAVPEARRAPYQVIADRRRAIEAAIQEAKAGDMVLIAGKGHEDYQILGTTKIHFDDREVAREALLRKVKA